MISRRKLLIGLFATGAAMAGSLLAGDAHADPRHRPGPIPG